MVLDKWAFYENILQIMMEYVILKLVFFLISPYYSKNNVLLNLIKKSTTIHW